MDLAVVEKKASQLLHRGVAQLLKALTFGIKLSRWRFETSESAAGGVSVFKAIGVSVSGGNVYLFYDPTKDRTGTWANSNVRARLVYGVGGVSVGIPIPYDPVAASYSAASWPNAGALLYFPGHEDFDANPQCFNDPSILSAPTMLIQADAALLPLRWILPGAAALPAADVLDRQIAGSAALMFLGVNPLLQALLKSLASNFRALVTAATHKPPTTTWGLIEDSVTRPLEVAWNLEKIEAEMMFLLPSIQTLVCQSRGVLATWGVEAALPGAGLAVYYQHNQELGEREQGGAAGPDEGGSRDRARRDRRKRGWARSGPSSAPRTIDPPKPFTTGGN